jgi:hypothetical protein
MNEIGLMHYFLGLEAWHVLGDILLGKGMYSLRFEEI